MKTLALVCTIAAFVIGGACQATPPVVAPTATEVAAEAAKLLVAVEATKAAWVASEVELQKQLDLKVAQTTTPEGVTAAGAATVAAVAAAMEVSPDLKTAAFATTQTTHDAWVACAAGVSYVRVPEWTKAVHLRASCGAKAATSAAIAQQIVSEQRIERLVNPSWADQIAWWWSR